MKTYMLVDTHYLCHRAFYTTGQLSFNGELTGVAFGVLKEIEKQRDLYNPDCCVFAFDYGGQGKRGEIYPGYKSSRRDKEDMMTDDEKENRRLFFEQIKTLYASVLPDMGFRNIFKARGYEGDDIIARLTLDLRGPGREVIIVSGDEDLWQLLAENVLWVAPRGKIVTYDSFMKEWGLLPSQWSTIKAIAGCSTDDVVGVKGVGEVTAAKWLKGELKPDSKKAAAIREALEGGLIDRNRRLVTLPFDGTPSFDLQEDEFTEQRRRDVMSRLGIRGNQASDAKPAVGFF